MNLELRDLAANAIALARSAGASASTLRITSSRQVEIMYRQRKPETIKEATSRSLSIDLYVKGRYYSQWTSDLRPAALEEFIANAVAMTSLLEEDPDRSLPDPRYYEGRADVDLDLLCSGHDALSATERHGLVQEVEAASFERGGPGIISVSAGMTDNHAESVMLTSNGFEGYAEATTYGMGAGVTVQDEGDRRPMGSHSVTVRHRTELPAPARVGAEAAERTLELLGAARIQTETMPVIVENRQVPWILMGLFGPMSGRAVQQRQSFLADRKGQPIGSELMTILDDPFVSRGLGSKLWDTDGMATRRRTMVDAGVLREFYVDWYYSRKLGCDPTTGSPTNVVIPPGRRSIPEIMRDLGRGVLITGFIGGNRNPTTGDQSVGIIGKLFENGEPVQAIAEMNMAGNMLTLWNSLIEVANDPWPYSSVRSPSLVFENVVVSGS